MSRLVPRRAPALLAEFAAAGLLGTADVRVATRLGALAGEPDERVLLAVALAVRGTRQGSIVLDLADAPDTTAELDEDDEPATAAAPLPWPDLGEWTELCARSPLVDTSAPGGAPLRLVGSRLWLDRYWRQEAQVADDLLRRVADPPHDLDELRLERDLLALFPDDTQRAAARSAATHRVSVIAGGPGTGKTTTIARLLVALLRQHPQLRIALAAPTGKAAARLEESVHAARDPLTDADRTMLAGLGAATVHRLLGRRPGAAGRFRHDRDNRLPYDLVVVDESSMVSLTLMARLLEALAPTTRLVLVGDPDQLASVEAGAVLGDLVEPGTLRRAVTTLRAVYRFDAGGPIDRLAQLIRDGAAGDALDLLRAQPPGITFYEIADDEPIGGPALAALLAGADHELAAIAAARAGDVTAALAALDTHRLLCAHRGGPRGVRHWSELIERRLVAGDPSLLPRLSGHYAGQPLLVTANDYENQLFNGDTGIVVQRGEDLVAAFRRGGAPVTLPLVRLADVRPLHAMTVHRAQGSQFDEVTVLLPVADSPLATRQTVYTAITRAAAHVTVVGSEAAVRAGVERRAARATGLRDRLAGAL